MSEVIKPLKLIRDEGIHEEIIIVAEKPKAQDKYQGN